jgi:O-antigen/teichoic acid export membrane protein
VAESFQQAAPSSLAAHATPGAPASQAGQESLARNVSVLMLGKTAAVAFTFALPLILVRRLAQFEFGLYKQAFLLISTSIAILPLGLAMSSFYFLPRVAARQRGSVVYNILLIYLLIGGGTGLLILLDPSVLVAIFNGPELVPYAPRIALALALLVSGSFLEYVMVACQETRQAAIFITATQFSKAALLIAAAIWLSTISALLDAAAIQGALQLLWVLAYLRRRFGSLWGAVDWGLLRAQLAYGFPLGLAALLYWFQTQLHLYFVAHRFGPVNYAVYAVGCFELPLMAILSESVCSVLIQRTNDLHSRDEHGALAALVMESVRNLSWFYLPLFAFLILAGREVIVLLFTTKYLASWPIFLVDCGLIPLMIPAVACDVLVRAYADYRFFLLKVRICLALTLVGVMYVAMSWRGPLGVILAVVLVAATERVIVSWRFARDLHILRGQRTLLLHILTIAGASAGAAFITLPVRHMVAGNPPLIVLIACGLVFSSAYLLFSRPWRMFEVGELIAELGLNRLFSGRRAANKPAIIQPRASEQ